MAEKLKGVFAGVLAEVGAPNKNAAGCARKLIRVRQVHTFKDISGFT